MVLFARVSFAQPWFGLLVIVCAGCTGDVPQLPTAPANAGTESATGTATADCMASLASGEWLLVDRRVDAPADDRSLRWLLCAKSASRAQLLAGLAEKLDFDLVQTKGPAGDFSGWVIGATPELLLQQMLRGLPLTFGYLPDGVEHRLARVTLADSLTNPAGADLAVGEYGDSVERTQIDAALMPVASDATVRFDAALHARWQVDYGHLEPLLTHPDAAVRIGTIDDIAAQGAGLQVLDRALASERDSSVRIALLRKLDESGSVLALQSMLKALSDTDSEVVAESIDMIADWQDVEVVERYVQPLLTHASNDVREAAKAAIDRFR